eukprot:m.595310 g.595310  ORF g.595310 m.595310 type:complete len:861 (+) comp22400_c0_seq6:200-2782(+)
MMPLCHIRTLVAVAMILTSPVTLALSHNANVNAAPSIVEYSLRYIGNLSDANAFEHTHLLAALGGLANGRAQWPVLFTPYSDVDLGWKTTVSARGEWLENATWTSPIDAGPTAIPRLLELPALSAVFKGFVVYDPLVPATSNVASTIAGVEDLLPIAYRPNDTDSLFSQLHLDVARPGDSDTPGIVVNLVGKFNGSRTGSSKCDAYMWAKETYLDTGLANSSLLAYYVDYFAVTNKPSQPRGFRAADASRATSGNANSSPGPAADRIVQGQQLCNGQSLLSVNGVFEMDIVSTSVIVRNRDTNTTLWTSASLKSRQHLHAHTQQQQSSLCCLALDATGNLALACTSEETNLSTRVYSSSHARASGASRETGDTVGNVTPVETSSPTVVWQTNTHGSGGAFWLWMQHDGNLVLYQGTCCMGKVLWSSGTAQPEKCGVPAAQRRQRWERVQGHLSGDINTLAKTTNHDFFIGHRAFFFDLSVWDDETPNDDPHQPLGADRATLLAIMGSAYNVSSANGSCPSLIHIGGFVPWHYKYVKDGKCGAHCKHGGVETEWATVCAMSGYNAYIDADACCIGAMANAALWQHYPLPPVLAQKVRVPSLADLQRKGYVDASGRVVPNTYAAFYAGDYDSASWLYSQLKSNWDDPNRGKVPIGWAVDPGLSERFPVIYPYLYNTATSNDIIIAGDSGGGYLNPSQLLPPRAVSNIPQSGARAWIDWNTALYSRFNLSFTGFIINGDAGTVQRASEAMYDVFSPNGIVVSLNEDWRGAASRGGVTSGGTPVMHHVMDLPGGDPGTATKNVVAFVAVQPKEHPTFAVFRTILQSATYHYTVATDAAKQATSLVFVDPLTLGALVKHTHTQDN